MAHSLPFFSLLLSTFTAAVVLSLAPTTARAEEIEPPTKEALEAPTEGHDDDLLITAGLAAVTDESGGGGALSLNALRQTGVFAYGATFEHGGIVFDHSYLSAAPVAGVFVPSPRWLRLGIAGTFGVRSYTGVGRGLLSNDPGTSGTVPFIGARGYAGIEIGGHARVHIGLQVSVDDDLARLERTYTYRESVGLGTSTRDVTANHAIGFLRFGGGLVLGGAFDL